MKTLFLPLLMSLVTATHAMAQKKDTTDNALEAQIIDLDKRGWEAWKNNDPAWFIENTVESFKSISSDGISTKAEVVRATRSDCKVMAYSLSELSFSVLDENAVLLTYKATQDAVCGGKKAPAALVVAVNYVKRGGRWLEAMYMQAP